MVTLRDRYRGCLLGLACGDALGGPVEFESRRWIAERYPDGVRDFVGGGWLSLEPGEVTDDTQLTLALARSLGQGGALDMAGVAHNFREWHRSCPKDEGNLTRAALNLLDGGTPWTEAGEIARGTGASSGAGNGSVMRCAPVALRFASDRGSLISASIDTSRITHADPRCTWGTVTVNQAIVWLLAGGDKNGVVKAAIDGIAEPTVVDAVERSQTIAPTDLNASGYVLNTLTSAFWALLSYSTLEEVIVEAVGLGRDTDTTGAVAGALAGAHWGRPGIPDRWLVLLQPRQELEDISDRLLALAHN
ncbi:MAG: ADP-ribosylglycohydrolase family protein [Thermomicrobiales bacterium]